MSTKLRERMTAVPPSSWAVSIARAIAAAIWNSRVRLSRYIHRKTLGLLAHSRVDAIDVYARPGDDPERVGKAMAFLAALDRRRHQRVRRYIKTIVYGGDGTHFDQYNDACYFDFNRTPDPLNDAVALVHEATHAYLLHARGLAYVGESREAHERLCVREEAAVVRGFSKRLDPEKRAGFVSQWADHHKRCLESRWWEMSRWSRFRGMFSAMRKDLAKPWSATRG